jgi:putative FmdB family regulatory protein
LPTYDYKCTKCKKEFEFFQSMSDKPLTECPECHGKMKRKIGAGLGPIFKGSGFYETDYKKHNNSSSSSSTPRKTD